MKPEKMKVDEGGFYTIKLHKNTWNDCCDEWEKWLPSEEEIEKICENVICQSYRHTKIAKAISKRLRGEK